MPAAKKKTATKRAADTRAAQPCDLAHGLAQELAQAAWAEADRALAEAMAEFEAWQQGDVDAAVFVGQALRRAARTRGLTPLSQAGRVEPYDASRHALANTPSTQPSQVRIKSAGVLRGGEVLAKARATPLRRRS
jgi:hypothetical protein